MQIRHRFTDALIDRRKDIGMSRGKAAAAAGLDISALFRLERGQREPTFATVEKLALVLGFDVMVGRGGTIYTWEDTGDGS